MKNVTTVSLDDTAAAFAYKPDRELRLALFLFSAMRFRWFVYLATRTLPLLIRWRLPVRWLIRRTIFRQFVGGETLEETIPVKKKLAVHGVGAIMDYGLERMSREEDFEKTCREYIDLIGYTSKQPGTPYISLKMTSLARFELLAGLNNLAALNRRNIQTFPPGSKTVDAEGWISPEAFRQSLSYEQEWRNVERRLSAICAAAARKQVGVLIDAEESWIQHSIDWLTLRMIYQFNRRRPVVFNTYQLYRTDVLELLKADHRMAGENGFVLGAKLVRGAYLEKERRRAARRGLPSPIHDTKEATDACFNEAVRYCVQHLPQIVFIVASHNEYSNQYALALMAEAGLPADHPSVHFSQLYGMGDHITFNLAAAGYSVTKYLPYGPLEKVIPYLMRRVQENSSIGGQTGRELGLLKKELKRRKELRK